MTTKLRGRLLIPEERGFSYIEDGVIELEEGVIQRVGVAEAGSMIEETHPGSILLPAFTDSHIHFPQTLICGTASGALLTWLNSTTFPEEARFAEQDYAEQVADLFTQNVLRAGVSSLSAYSSAHKGATHVLFAALERYGLKGLAGMVLMNRNAPEAILVDVEEARAGMHELVDTWHGRDNERLRYCVTPRFAISCDAPMMEMAGRFAEEKGLWVQSHVSENLDEVAFSCSLFPDSESYLKIYRDFGMLHERSLYAHCIHFDDADWELFGAAKAVVAHCPDSNFFLGSGCMQYERAQKQGIRLSIGTDVGGGRSFSMRISASRAYDASLMVGAPVTPEEILWTATLGGAMELGFNQSWSSGGEADLMAISCPEYGTKREIIDHLLFRHDEPSVEATYVRGVCCYRRTEEGEWFKGLESL